MSQRILLSPFFCLTGQAPLGYLSSVELWITGDGLKTGQPNKK